MADIEIKGIDKIVKKLGAAGSMRVMRPAMVRSVLRLQRDMATYPPQRSGSQYIRTGTLGRRWTTKIASTNTGMIGTVGNNTIYGPFVQSSTFQAEVHRNRWQTDQDVVNRNQTAIIADFANTLDKAMK